MCFLFKVIPPPEHNNQERTPVDSDVLYGLFSLLVIVLAC